ncbi:hypothetical protein [Methylobacterium nigriterrae]|uniref:hypothetical protein n=1 Tax=Methylobacterium nigriterrae TaxID=3127512 RepID=UPI003013783E
MLEAHSGHLTTGLEEPASEPGSARLQLNRAGWSELNRLAQDLTMPLPNLMAQAFNDLLLKHGRPPVVEAKPSGQEITSDSALTIYSSPLPLIWPGLMGAWYWHHAVTLPVLALWNGAARPCLR